MREIEQLISELKDYIRKLTSYEEKYTGFFLISPSPFDPWLPKSIYKDYLQLSSKLCEKIVERRRELHFLLYKQGKLPLKLKEEYTINSLPFIYSYEEIKKDFFLLYDVTHGFEPEIVPRIRVFIEGIKKINPTIIFLELARDVNKYIEMYFLGKIDRITLDKIIFDTSYSSGLDSYPPLLDYARENNIRVKAVDLPFPKNSNPLSPEKIYSTKPKNSKEFYRREKEILDIQIFIREENMLNMILDEITNGDRSLMIIGNAHRLTFPKLFTTFFL